MEIRPLGRSRLAAPPAVFGCNGPRWTADQATSFRLLDAAALRPDAEAAEMLRQAST